jgi:hypothetical protein
MVINISNKEFLIEIKIYYSLGKFTDGKKQLAYYCKSLGLIKGAYLVFCPNTVKYPETVKEGMETFEGVEISSYLITYDESKWE